MSALKEAVYESGWKDALKAAYDRIAGLTDGDSPIHDGAINDALQEINKLMRGPHG